MKEKLKLKSEKQSQLVQALRKKVQEAQYNDLIEDEKQKQREQREKDQLEREKAQKRREFLKQKRLQYDQLNKAK